MVLQFGIQVAGACNGHAQLVKPGGAVKARLTSLLLRPGPLPDKDNSVPAVSAVPCRAC